MGCEREAVREGRGGERGRMELEDVEEEEEEEEVEEEEEEDALLLQRGNGSNLLRA